MGFPRRPGPGEVKDAGEPPGVYTHTPIFLLTTTLTLPPSPPFPFLVSQENWHPLYNGGLSSNPLKAITEVPPEGLLQASRLLLLDWLRFLICRRAVWCILVV